MLPPLSRITNKFPFHLITDLIAESLTGTHLIFPIWGQNHLEGFRRQVNFNEITFIVTKKILGKSFHPILKNLGNNRVNRNSLSCSGTFSQGHPSRNYLLEKSWLLFSSWASNRLAWISINPIASGSLSRESESLSSWDPCIQECHRILEHQHQGERGGHQVRLC